MRCMTEFGYKTAGFLMASTVQELFALGKTLDRLEQRITEIRTFLNDKCFGRSTEGDYDRLAITKGEVETIEALILRLARRITGADPHDAEWEPMNYYCSRNEEKGKPHW